MTDDLHRRLNALVQQVGELDRKVTFLFRHLGVEYQDTRPPPDEIERLVIAGDRVAAVKLYQTKHGVGIGEAKRAVDTIAARLGL